MCCTPARTSTSIERTGCGRFRRDSASPAALVISRALHVVTVACLLALAWVTPLSTFYLAGVGVVALLLAYEQSLVRADDLSQVKRAFDLNGYVGILYLLVLAASIYGR